MVYPTLHGSPIGLKHNINPPRFDFRLPNFGRGYIQFLSMNMIRYNCVDEISTTHTLLSPLGSTATREGCYISPRGSHYYVSSEPAFRFIFEYEFFAITTLESPTYGDFGHAVGSDIAMGEYEFLCAIDSYRHLLTSYDHPTDPATDTYYLSLYPFGSRGCIYDGTYMTGTGGHIPVVPIDINITLVSNKHYWSRIVGCQMYSNYVASCKFESILTYDTRFIEAIDALRFLPAGT